MLIPIAIKKINATSVYIYRDDVVLPNQNPAYVSFTDFVMSLHPAIGFNNCNYYVLRFMKLFDNDILCETDTMYARIDGKRLPQIFLTLRGAVKILKHVRSNDKISLNKAKEFYKECLNNYD